MLGILYLLEDSLKVALDHPLKAHFMLISAFASAFLAILYSTRSGVCKESIKSFKIYTFWIVFLFAVVSLGLGSLGSGGGIESLKLIGFAVLFVWLMAMLYLFLSTRS